MEKKKKRHTADDPEAKLRELLKQESNSRCADCGAAKPRYASITLGIFICNRCYGIHRSIGTHITRTKCMGLDNWSAPDVQRMQSIGNAVAAAFWQKNLPNGYSIPTAEASDSVVEKWIRDKYERKLFCPVDSTINQQQCLGYLGASHSSKEGNSQIDDWSPFIGANSTGNWPASNPSSSMGVWDPFSSDATQSNRSEASSRRLVGRGPKLQGPKLTSLFLGFWVSIAGMSWGNFNCSRKHVMEKFQPKHFRHMYDTSSLRLGPKD